jgi:hypothetical protein
MGGRSGGGTGNLFQLCEMREMTERKEVQREQIKAGCKKEPRATQLAID